MPKLGDIVQSREQQVDPIISEISLVRQILKERAHALDLVRELLSNAGARARGPALGPGSGEYRHRCASL